MADSMLTNSLCLNKIDTSVFKSDSIKIHMKIIFKNKITRFFTINFYREVA